MLQSLHAAWRARRVLLAGEDTLLTRFMQTMLLELGARPARIPPMAERDRLARALTDGRVACLIVPSLRALSGALDAQLRALDALLSEAREAGVPLALLLSDENVYRAIERPWYAREGDPIGGETREGLFQSILQLFAEGVSRGLLGDAVSVLCVRHAPCLGCGHPAVAPYDGWCRALEAREPLHVPHPGAQGVFLHPLCACLGALLLGARFLLGDTACTGAFNLGVGAQNVMPNRTAALHLMHACGHTRPMLESEPPRAVPAPLPDGSRARLLCGAAPLLSGYDALDLHLELHRAAQAGTQEAVVRAQTRHYLETLRT